MLTDVLELDTDQISASLIALRMRLFYATLPAVIREELEKDQDVIERLGIQLRSVVPLGNLMFERSNFWAAVQQVVGGEAASVIPIDHSEAVTFEPPGEDQQAVFTFQLPGSEARFRMTDKVLRLVSPVLSVREEVLRDNRQWFDCSDELYERLFAEIAMYPEAEQRVEAVTMWRERNIALHYDSFEEQIRSRRSFQLYDLLLPDIENFRHHFRIDWTGTPDVRALLSSAAPRLHKEIGLAEAIERLARFPIALPDITVVTVQSLSLDDQRKLVRHLLQLADSPLSIVHLIKLLYTIGQHRRSYERLARWLVAHYIRMLDDETINAFLALLTWVHGSVEVNSAAEHIPDAVRLALVWAHTDKIFRILVAAGVSTAWMIQTFATTQTHLARELLKPVLSFWHDVAHPRKQSPLVFLVAGLGYSVAGDRSLIINDTLREQLRARLSITVDGKQYPSPTLLVNTAYASNKLTSFLGENRLEQFERLVGLDEQLTTLADPIVSLVEQAIEKLLTTSADEQAWTTLHLMLGNFPPAPHVKERLAVLFLQVNLAELFRQNPLLGVLALETLVQQVGFMDSAIGNHLYEQLVSVAQVLGSAETQDRFQSSGADNVSLDYAILQLLEASIYVTRAAFPAQPIERQYSALIQNIADILPLAAVRCRPFIEYICRHLPIAQARYFWPLLLRLRAE